MAEEPVELGYYGAVLRRHRWLVAACAALGAVATAAVVGGEPTYTATAEVVVRPITTTATGSAAEPDRVINTSTEQQIARSTAVAELANQRLGAEDAGDLLDHLTVVVPADSQILGFQYSSPDRSMARAGAQAFAEAYLTYRGRDAVAAVEERIAALEAEVGDLTAQLVEANVVINQADADGPPPDPLVLARAQSRRELLLSALSVTNATRAELQELRVDPGEVIAPAAEAQASGQNRGMLLLVGAGAGAVLGAVAAFVLDRLRARVNVARDLREELGVPVLATIPAVARRSQIMVTHTEPRTSAAHAYRRLAVALSLGHERPARSVLVVGATKDDPAATVALNLAIALIQQGRRVLVVSADRHDPRIDRCFDLVGQPGLDEHLARRGTTEPQEVLRDLLVLPAGTGEAYPVHNVAPREAVAATIERGLRIADIVVIHAPPALDYPDAEVMGPLVDAVIAAATAEQTPRAAVADLRDRLALVSAPLRGAVLVSRPTIFDRIEVALGHHRRSPGAPAATTPPDGDAERAARPTTPPSSRTAKPAPAPAPSRPGATRAAVPAVASGPAGSAPSADRDALKARIDALLRDRGMERESPPGNGRRSEARAAWPDRFPGS